MRQGRVTGYLKIVTDAYDAGVKLVAWRRASTRVDTVDPATEAELVWLDFLKRLDADAYRTRIIIDVDPRSWGRKL